MTPHGSDPRSASATLAAALQEARIRLEKALKAAPGGNSILAPVLTALATAEVSCLTLKQSNLTPEDVELEQLKLRVRELELAIQARDEFIATLGHELRNPLSPVYLQVQQLLQIVGRARGSTISADLLLPKIEQFAQRFQRFLQTLNRILEVSRINTGRVELSLQTVDLADVVRDVAATMLPEVAASGSELRIHADQPIVGDWDRLRLEQISMNLLSNAVRYGLGKPIEIAIEEQGAWAVLRVTDHGMGIAALDQERIFKPFERGTGMRRAGGFGIGLWIVNNLCEALGGKVEVSSELGKGSTFVVKLPRDRKQDS